MNFKLITAAAIALAVVSTSAHAGGFRYKSKGGNWGSWAYSDGAAGGDAKAFGKYEGETSSESYALSENFRYHDGTGSRAESGNQSKFEVEGYGMGWAHSGSSAVAGSGIGDGSGFKRGYTR